MEITRRASCTGFLVTVSITGRLRLAAAALRADRVPVRVLLDAHGPATHGALLILLAVPCLLPVPGVGLVLGLGIAVLAAQMLYGSSELRLPARVAALELPRHVAQRVLGLIASCYAIGGRWMKARLGHLTGDTYRWLVASTAALMAVLIVLPIPLGNFLPAAALIVLGCGLVFLDGLAILLGFATATLAVLFNVAVVVAVWHFGGVLLAE
jgi:hypothetical protein